MSESSSRRERVAEILRFLAGGASTTAVSYAIYLLLLVWLPYLAAYLIAYVFGIAWSYAINTWFVFRSTPSFRRALAFPLVYLAQYLVGSMLLYVLVDGFRMPAAFGPLVVAVLTLPLTYVLSRRVIAR